MPLTHDDVMALADLARIELQPAEAAAVGEQLKGIFSLIERLQAVDTRGVEPMSQPGDAALRLREDRVTEENRREIYQALAPHAAGGLYLVPKVIE